MENTNIEQQNLENNNNVVSPNNGNQVTNKDTKLQKILLGLSAFFACVTGLVVFNLLTTYLDAEKLSKGSNGRFDFEEYMRLFTDGRLNNINLYISASFTLAIILLLFIAYLYHTSSQKGESFIANIEGKTSIGMVVAVFGAHFIGRDFIEILRVYGDAVNGKFNASKMLENANNLMSRYSGSGRNADALAKEMANNMYISFGLFTVAFVLAIATAYFIYNKLYKKKA